MKEPIFHSVDGNQVPYCPDRFCLLYMNIKTWCHWLCKLHTICLFLVSPGCDYKCNNTCGICYSMILYHIYLVRTLTSWKVLLQVFVRLNHKTHLCSPTTQQFCLQGHSTTTAIPSLHHDGYRKDHGNFPSAPTWPLAANFLLRAPWI